MAPRRASRAGKGLGRRRWSPAWVLPPGGIEARVSARANGPGASAGRRLRDLDEELVRQRAEAGQTRIGREPFPRPVAALALARDDDGLALRGQHEPHDRHPDAQVPPRFVAQLWLALVAAGDLDR